MRFSKKSKTVYIIITIFLVKHLSDFHNLQKISETHLFKHLQFQLNNTIILNSRIIFKKY